MVLDKRLALSGFFLLTISLGLGSPTEAQTVSLFSEDFESLALGPIVTFDSEIRENQAWTETPPAGWTVDDTHVPTFGNPDTGVAEYEGWSFVSRDWWILSAGDQQRSEFLGGSGVVAVADPDEWDDFGNPGPDNISLPVPTDDPNYDPAAPFDNPSFPNGYDARLRTKPISLAGAPSGEDVKIFFNSSWRPEDLQKATLTATFNDGAATQYQLLRYESQERNDNLTPGNPADDFDNPFYKPDATNEGVLISLADNTSTGGSDFSIPSGATSFELEFRMLDAANDWWWAFDNLQVFTGDNPPVGGALKVVIDRDTNNVKIVNETDSAVNLRGYSVVSGTGVFLESDANFLAPADDWLKATRVDDESNDLSEINLTSATLAVGGEIDFGDVWVKYFNEGSLEFEYLIEGQDDPIPGLIEYVGNEIDVEGELEEIGYEFLDLNYDNEIDILDWQAFKAGFGKSLEGLTEAQRYNLSDLDNDGKHTAQDFLIFQSTFDSANGAGAFAEALAAAPEPGALLLSLAGLSLVALRRSAGRPLAGPLLLLALTACWTSPASAQLKLFTEDFEGALLGPYQEEDISDSDVPNQNAVWTNSYAGWNNVNAGDDVPGVHNSPSTPISDSDGVADWSDWAFVRKDAWIAADDQGRGQFSRGSGTVLVADPDEWDDADGAIRDPIAQGPNPDDLYDVFVASPVINIPAGIPAGRIKLSFDSSWQGNEYQDDLDNQNNQTALVKASYDGGAFGEVFRRESDPESSGYTPQAFNERISQIDLDYDGVATTLQLEFGLTGAWNDWWWGIDNIEVSVPANPLKLRINTFNGQAFLEGDDAIDTTINFISIESEKGVLTGDRASGLSGAGLAAVDGPDPGTTAGDFSGEQWENLTDSETADKLFAEAFLFGDSAFNDSHSIDLGLLFNAATPVGDRDVTFRYTTNVGDDVTVPTENVEYFFDDSVGLPGDFNGDLVVDAVDYAVWREGLGTIYSSADFLVWKNNYGAAQAAAGVQAPEPGGALLVLLATAACLLGRRHLKRPVATLLVCGVVLGVNIFAGSADALAQVTLDRDYKFGDDSREGAVSGAIVGTGNGSGLSVDSAGATGMNQIISLLPAGPSGLARPRYVDVTDRPDMLPGSNVLASAGLGVGLNQAPAGSFFNAQYLHTGFEEALNFPQQSPSATRSPGGTINYNFVSDSGFQLWVKPTRVTESHIVMDTNQHGVFINADGEFAMRYAFDQSVIDSLAQSTGQPASDFADIFDYASGVVAQPDTWYHLSVVRPFGPSSGSIFYLDGVAVAATTGRYLEEEVVTDDNTELDLSKLDRSPLVVGANTGNPSFGDSKYFSGIVDDLEMFVMGQNQDNVFPDYVFEFDNDYAAAFKPTTLDLTGEGALNVADAVAFSESWLFQNRVVWTDRLEQEQSLIVGDLYSRSKGDFNYDGVVDLADWAILNNASPAVASQALRAIAGYAVPEPASAGLVLAGMLWCSNRRRRLQAT